MNCVMKVTDRFIEGLSIFNKFFLKGGSNLEWRMLDRKSFLPGVAQGKWSILTILFCGRKSLKNPLILYCVNDF